MSEPVAWPECEEFYNLMQAYRHARIVDREATIDAYEAVKEWLRAEIERKDAAIAELTNRAISCEQSYTRERAERAEMAIAELVQMLKDIQGHPSCRREVDARLGEDTWDVIAKYD